MDRGENLGTWRKSRGIAKISGCGENLIISGRGENFVWKVLRESISICMLVAIILSPNSVAGTKMSYIFVSSCHSTDANFISRALYSNSLKNFKRPNTREDSSDLDEKNTLFIAAMRSTSGKKITCQRFPKNGFKQFFSRKTV